MGLEPELRQTLFKQAIDVRQRAYAPYSNFKVGAAILAVDGRIFTGCNVENASFGLTICAERGAICKAVSEGIQNIVAIAIAATPLASPCGACRQFIFEFGDQIEVFSVDADFVEHWREYSSSQLLPDGFRLS